MKSLFPKIISPGSTIGVVAPSGASNPELVQLGLKKLQARGFATKVAENVAEKTQFTAGSRELRIRETVKIFRDNSVDAVLCARGGDGAIHLLPELLEELEGSQPKPFIGYSDITLLQLALYKFFGWVSFSGPMLTTELADNSLSKESLDHLWSLTMKPPQMWNLNPPLKDKITILRNGQASGILLGGCLSLICALIGSPYLPDFKDAILIIEDVEETPQSIDRMLHQLRISGIFESIKGLILGGFSGCFPGEGKSESALSEIVMAATSGYNFPVITDYPYGHSLRDRLTIPIGAPINFRTDPLDISLDLETVNQNL